MTKRRQALGREGEQLAARYLEAQGYRIVARNVRAARVEIDLIVRRGQDLIIVEVKSRRETGANGFGHHGAAAEAVDRRKQARLRNGTRAWLIENPQERRRTRRIRFDVVTCLLRDSRDPRDPRDPDFLPSREKPHGSLHATDRKSEGQNDTTAPQVGARWSIQHWQAAFE